MNPSEMTNEELEKALMRRVPLDSNNYDDIREASARLRKLKIAEDALKRIDNMCDGDMCKFFYDTHHCSACRYLESCQTGVAHAALAAIREKGEEDDK